MSYTVEKLEHSMAKITIEVEAEEFDKAIVQAYKNQKGKISVPGFRKGKVPMSYLEKAYGPEMFYNDAANICIQEAYPREMADTDLEIVSRPEIDVEQAKKGEKFIFTATVALKPEVTLGEYKGIEVEKTEVVVTDKDIEQEVMSVRMQNSRKVEVKDRPAADGDSVSMAYEGSIEGVPFEGGKNENAQLVIGSNTYIDGFESQIIGKNIGEDFEIHVTFPEDYSQTELAGKPAVFQCKLHSILADEIPELNDEFISDTTEFNSIDEFMDDLKKRLQVKKEAEGKQQKEEKVVDKIVENATIDIPEPMIEMQQDQMIDELAQRLAYQKLSFENFLQFSGQTMDGFREQIKPDAVKRIQARLVLEAIANQENIEVSDEEFDAEIQKMASMYNMEADNLKASVGEPERKSITKDIAIQKAVDLVRDSAKEV